MTEPVKEFDPTYEALSLFMREEVQAFHAHCGEDACEYREHGIDAIRASLQRAYDLGAIANARLTRQLNIALRAMDFVLICGENTCAVCSGRISGALDRIEAVE